MLGPVRLVERVEKSYFVRPAEDIIDALEAVFGVLPEGAGDNLVLKIVGIARSLNDGELTQAMLKALYLRLPEIALGNLAKMGGVLEKYNQNHNPENGEFTSGAGGVSGEGSSGGVPNRPKGNPKPQTEATHSGVIIGAALADGSVVQVHLNGFGNTYLDPGFASKVKEFDKNTREAGVSIHYTSAYRSSEKQNEIRDNGLGVTPAEHSLHSAGLAIDVKYAKLPPNEQKIIRDAAEKAGLKWGGNFRHPKADPVHFYYDPGGNRRQRIQNFNHKVSRLSN